MQSKGNRFPIKYPKMTSCENVEHVGLAMGLEGGAVPAFTPSMISIFEFLNRDPFLGVLFSD